MGLDIYLGPANGFHDWKEKDWNNYWASSDLIGEKVGSWTAIAETIETIRYNLNRNRLFRKYKTFFMIEVNGFDGWYNSELSELKNDLKIIKEELMKLPLENQKRIIIDGLTNTVSLKNYSGEYIEELKNEFKRHYPNRELDNLYDLNHHFIDTLLNFTDMALTSKKGIILNG